MTLQAGQVPTALAALAVVVGLIWLCARLARSSGFARSTVQDGGSVRLAVEGTLVLDRARRLHLVRCAGRELVVLTGGERDQLLLLGAQDRTPGGDRA